MNKKKKTIDKNMPLTRESFRRNSADPRESLTLAECENCVRIPPTDKAVDDSCNCKYNIHYIAKRSGTNLSYLK